MGWIRALLFIFLYLSVLLAVGLCIALLFKANGADLSTMGKDSRILLLSVMSTGLVSFAMVAASRKWIDRQSFLSLGFDLHKMKAQAFVGFWMGILLLSVGTIFLNLTGYLQWTDFHFNGKDLFISLGLMIVVAFSEEIVFRGYLLQNLMASMGPWPALLVSALLFALAHAANPDFTILAAFNIFLAGILLGINYIHTRNLWYAILLHFSWNFFQGPILGYEVSGQNLQSLLQHDVHGSTWMTGGKFGMEGSITCTVLLVIAIVALALLYKRNNPVTVNVPNA